jgi:hypothetical protein
MTQIIIDPMYLAICGIVIILLILRIIYQSLENKYLSKQVKKPEVVYVDKSGITSIKDMNFLDVKKKKTLNFKVGKEAFSITQIKVMQTLTIFDEMVLNFQRLKAVQESKVEAKMKQIYYNKIYADIGELIYQLALPISKSKKRLKKEILLMVRNDVESVLDIASNIINYWLPVKKKALLLAKGTTLQQTAGKGSSWNSVAVDMDLNISWILPSAN